MDLQRQTEEKRPFLLMLSMFFLAFLAAAGGAISLIILAAPGNDDYIIGSRITSKGEFLMKMLPSFALFLAAALIAYGLWKERGWTRPMLLAFFGLPELGKYLLPGWRSAPAGILLSRLILSGLMVGLLGWYLYRKQNVVRYYHLLSLPNSDPSTPVRPD